MYVPLLLITVLCEYHFSTILITIFSYKIFTSIILTVLSVVTITSAQYTDPVCPIEEEPWCAVRCNVQVDEPICVKYSGCDGVEITLQNQCVLNGYNCRCQSSRKLNIEIDVVATAQVEYCFYFLSALEWVRNGVC